MKELSERMKSVETSEQKRWSHSQLDEIERIQALLGRYIAERRVADEFLKNACYWLGNFRDTKGE